MTTAISPRDYCEDLWASLSHVIGTESGDTSLPAKFKVPWLDLPDQRRLAAYRALWAYRSNNRRMWLPPDMWTRKIDVSQHDGALRHIGRSAAEQYREYGDGMLLVEAARGIVLGDEQVIHVKDDEKDESDGVKYLRAWAEKIGLTAKLLEGEEHSIGDGDGVYVVSWAKRQERPALSVFDPGFYFPDWGSLDDPAYAEWGDEDYPPVVHFAWEVDRGEDTFLIRTSYVMTEMAVARPTAWGTSSNWTCIKTVTEWNVNKLPDRGTIYDFTGGTDTSGPEDLFLDFIPVVHVPNDTPGERRWGRSLVSKVAQLLDDIHGADTDLSLDAETIASPPLLTTGGDGEALNSGPRSQWNFPENGSAGFVDTSKNLLALTGYSKGLLNRLGKISRIGDVLLGEVKPNEVPSGYALRLGFAPAEALVREMRVVRNPKYALLLKMVLRIAQANGKFARGETPQPYLKLGASMPSDRAALILEVQNLIERHAISYETAVGMLIDAGLPIEDAAKEVERLKSQNTLAAVQIVDATGDVAQAYDWLGLTKPDGAAPPGFPPGVKSTADPSKAPAPTPTPGGPTPPVPQPQPAAR